MLFFLFSEDELSRLFSELATEFRLRRRAGRSTTTSSAADLNGSTLSFVTHAAILAPYDPEGSWSAF